MADAAGSDVRMRSRVSLIFADGSHQAGHALPLSEPSQKQARPLMALQLASSNEYDGVVLMKSNIEYTRRER